jgi:glucose/arabinose dehydrogenase
VKQARPELVAQALARDYALGPHTGSSGLVFSTDGPLRTRFGDGAFVGQHGLESKSTERV